MSYTSTDSLRRTFVFIEIDGQTFDWWTDYTITSDLLHGSDGFVMHAPALPRADEGRGDQQTDLDARGIKRGATVKIYVKTPEAAHPVLQHTAIIEDVTIEEDAEGGARITIRGRDHMSPIMDCDTPPSLALENVSFAEMIARLLTTKLPGQPKPFFESKQVIFDNDTNRNLLTGKPSVFTTLSKQAPIAPETLKLDQAKPHPGETIYEYLKRHAQRFGLLIWGTADGKIVFGRPNYDQAPRYALQMRRGDGDPVRSAARRNNVKNFSRTTSFRGRPSEVHVYGHSRGGDHMRSAIHGVVYDTEVSASGLWRILTVHDNNARTKAEAEQRALYELSLRKQNGDVINARVDGHAWEDGTVWAIDTIADVQWDLGGVHEPRYVIARTFSCTENGGRETTVTVVPKGAIALGSPEQFGGSAGSAGVSIPSNERTAAPED